MTHQSPRGMLSPRSEGRPPDTVSGGAPCSTSDAAEIEQLRADLIRVESALMWERGRSAERRDRLMEALKEHGPVSEYIGDHELTAAVVAVMRSARP